MTATIENAAELQAEVDAAEAQAQADARGRTKDRDFSKFTPMHQDLAEFINSNEDFLSAGCEPLTPNQIKAVIALRSDFNDTPEQRAKREEARKRREAEAEKYKGMTQEEIKAEKAAQRAEAQAMKLQQRVQEALEKAQRIREGKDATGADLAAEVEAQQNGSPSEAAGADEAAPVKRTIGRSRAK